MSGRTYQQYCGVAAALDVVGERWTLLLVRDLLLGPLRYRDLAALQPAMASDLLTARLRKLEAHDLVERVELPPPTSATVYRLTDAGRGLEPVIESLAVAGARLLPPALDAPDGWGFRAGWGLATIAEHLGDQAPEGGGIELVCDGWVTSMRRDGDRAAVERAPAPAADARIIADDRLALGVLTGHVKPADVEVDGDRRVLRSWISAIRRTAPDVILAPTPRTTRD
ncbi:MAG: helix-turn-helix domain-containing protein [Actinomycetota bacterium]